MAKFTQKPGAPKIIWDAKKNEALCKFEKGVFETEDKAIMSRLKALGYEEQSGENGEGEK